ncbi:carboxypeptidase B isoform X1 [Folsomia candida]|uniref:Carboxypeptidase B n=2 Tax=Folsomia candida TaxID=158441 RepID=A0A226DRA0_FOLCA|nr:carboxypeptidase B isoform X1 [Folsomia candida]OXA47374.1 Carboxypeptidase B [Folsomia candida]
MNAVPLPASQFALTVNTLSCLMSMTSPNFDSNGRRSYEGFQVLSISNVSSQNDVLGIQQANILQQLYSSNKLFNFLGEDPNRNGPTDVMICPEQANNVKNLLSTFGIPFTVQSENYQQNIVSHENENNLILAESGGNMNWIAYQRFATIQSWMDSMASKYPKIVTLETYGSSSEKRPMRVIKISATGNDGSKPIVWLDGGIHAREWISVATVTYMANEIINRAVSGDRNDLINKVDWYIVPNMNPDGYEYTFTNDRLWRKTRSKAVNSTCYGVDPNRNWDFKWGGKGTSNDSCEITYRGPRPASEPEVASSQKYILSIKNRIKLFLTFHSYSQLLLLPWSYDNVLIPDKSDLEKVAKQGAQALEAVNGTKYIVGPTPQILYSAAGTSNDWVKGVANIKFAYTYELRDTGKDRFLLPPNQIIPSGKETFVGVTAMVQGVMDWFKIN